MIILVKQVKKRTIDIKHSLAWFLLDIVLIIFTAFPSILYKLTYILGIETPTNMLFFFGLILALVINYTQTIALSRLSERQKKMVQHIALEEYKKKEDGNDEGINYNCDIQ